MTVDLVCSVCETQYDAGKHEPWRCDCGNPLEYNYDPTAGATEFRESGSSHLGGLWRFEELIPVEQNVTLGEGFTPLVETSRWDVEFKLEYVFPSGSFKDRGATTVVSRASEIGVSKLVDDSSGNAGSAIAMYAAQTDIDAEIFVPATVKRSKVQMIEDCGATARRISGDRGDVTEACINAVEDGDTWYASHAWNPGFFAGTETFGFEVIAQRDWIAPDAVVMGVGHGTLFLGAYRGFKRLYRMGIIDTMPRMLAAQADGYAPIVESIRHSHSADSVNQLADGIHIQNPPRGFQIIDAIESTGGDAINVSNLETERTVDKLHQ